MWWRKEQKRKEELLEEVEKNLTKIRQLSLVMSDIGSIEVDESALISIPYDRYKEVVPGVFDRLVWNRTDYDVNKKEEKYRKKIKKIDFEKLDVVWVESNKNAFFDKHHHKVTERIYVLEGKVGCKKWLSLKPNDFEEKIYYPGQCIHIPAYTVHTFESIEDSFSLLTLEKATI